MYSGFDLHTTQNKLKSQVYLSTDNPFDWALILDNPSYFSLNIY